MTTHAYGWFSAKRVTPMRHLSAASSGFIRSPLPRVLSGGEQQRVAIARAVVNEPELLLADEPTGNLDPDLSVEIMRLFREINARGTTVVVATHDRDLVQRMQRRTVVLERGRLIDAGAGS